MGTLEKVASGARHELVGSQTVGRAPSCQLTLDGPEVSGVHAEILWDGNQWHIQDLASRNGTYLFGERLPPRRRAVLVEGAEVSFGGFANAYRFVEASAPRVVAVSDTGQRRVGDETGLLALPSPEMSHVTIFRDADRSWVAEYPSGSERLGVGANTLIAGGQRWGVHIPVPQSQTTMTATEAGVLLGDIELVLSVSRDGEHVDVDYRHEGSTYSLEFRAHAFLLVVLAERLLEDRAEGEVGASGWGWLHREELIAMLAIDPELLNVWVFRARKQLTEAGILGAGGIVERRTGQMRLGTARCRVIRA